MSAKRTKAKGRKRISRKPRPAPGPGSAARDLNAASRALLGEDKERRPYRPRSDDASVEDPLEDWPEG